MGEVKKLEGEMWNLKVKGTDMVGYNQQFQELALMYARMFPKESDKIEKYIVDAIELATDYATRRSALSAKRPSENKRKEYDNQQPTIKQRQKHGAGCMLQGPGFVSTAFSSQIDITPSTLDYYYDVELADGRIIGLNAIIWGCSLNFLNHLFNIDLMPVELFSLDVIIDMDWLAKYQDVIGNETRLNIISCTKMQKYMLKGCPIFLAHVTTKETEDKSEKKRLEDVPTVRDFPKVFPEDFLGLPLTRQVEFQINLIHGVVPVARAPYRLAPSEMKEL
ncbi:hypothetical protein Tco_1009874 [Tanacetum coccineum]